MTPYYTTVKTIEQLICEGNSFAFAPPPWYLVDHNVRLIRSQRHDKIMPGDVVLCCYTGSRLSFLPEDGIDTYIIHPSSGQHGWFWGSLLCKP